MVSPAPLSPAPTPTPSPLPPEGAWLQFYETYDPACLNSCMMFAPLRNEREVDRTTLVPIAPQHERALLTKPISTLRYEFKMRIGPKSSWIWDLQSAVQVQPISPIQPTSDIRLRRVLSLEKISYFLGRSNYPCSRHCSPRRAMTSPYPRPLSATSSLRHAYSSDAIRHTLRDVLPTHRLFIHAADSLNAASSPYTMLINDFLFALNAPNIKVVQGLPAKIVGEYPAVHIVVRHPRIFAHLVAYLHTRNQARLFREAIPNQDINDALYPLPYRRSTYFKGEAINLVQADAGVAMLKATKSLFKCHTRSSHDVDVQRTRQVISGMSPTSIASELALYDAEYLTVSDARSIQAASQAVLGLYDSLQELGFYEREIWTELKKCWGILRAAKTVQAILRDDEAPQGGMAAASKKSGEFTYTDASAPTCNIDQRVTLLSS